MATANLRLVLGGLLVVSGFSACGVDERALVYEYDALGSAGAGTSGRSGSAGSIANSSAGDAGELGAGANSAGETSAAGANPSGGTQSDAGSGANPNAGGAPTSGGSSGNGGTPTAGGGTSGVGSSGDAGSTFDGPCGDLNYDSIDDCSQTLVQNSRFDSAASGWDPEPTLTQTWDPTNASSKPGSGSLMLSNTAAVVPQTVGTATVGSHQCIPITPGATYDVAARIMLATGQSAGEGGVNVWLFDDAACQGNVVTGETPIHGGLVGKWIALRGTVWIPGSAHSMYVRLVAIKPFAQPSLNVLVDDVLVAKR